MPSKSSRLHFQLTMFETRQLWGKFLKTIIASSPRLAIFNLKVFLKYQFMNF